MFLPGLALAQDLQDLTCSISVEPNHEQLVPGGPSGNETDYYRFQFVITNSGADAAASSKARFKVGGLVWQEIAVPALQPGESFSFDHEGRPGVSAICAKYGVSIVVDTNGHVVETNEDNNTTVRVWPTSCPTLTAATNATSATQRLEAECGSFTGPVTFGRSGLCSPGDETNIVRSETISLEKGIVSLRIFYTTDEPATRIVRFTGDNADRVIVFDPKANQTDLDLPVNYAGDARLLVIKGSNHSGHLFLDGYDLRPMRNSPKSRAD